MCSHPRSSRARTWVARPSPSASGLGGASSVGMAATTPTPAKSSHRMLPATVKTQRPFISFLPNCSTAPHLPPGDLCHIDLHRIALLSSIFLGQHCPELPTFSSPLIHSTQHMFSELLLQSTLRITWGFPSKHTRQPLGKGEKSKDTYWSIWEGRLYQSCMGDMITCGFLKGAHPSNLSPMCYCHFPFSTWHLPLLYPPKARAASSLVYMP